eukprot:7611894-Pyramimonas_sp.AAC.1
MLAEPDSAEGFKLSVLVPQLLLRPLPRGTKGLQRVVITRCRAFLRGEWEVLCAEVEAEVESSPVRVRAGVTLERAARDARRLAMEGQFRRAVQRLELAHLAPPTPATVEALRALHPAENEQVEVDDGASGADAVASASPTASSFAPPAIDLTREAFDKAMRELPSASAPGPSQLRYEHLQVAHRAGAADLLFHVVRLLATGAVPEEAKQ